MILPGIYIRTAVPEDLPQLLQLVVEGECYTFSILHAGYERFSAARSEARREGHAHAVYHIVLFVEGENEFMLGGESLPCRSGTLVITSPGEAHEFPPRLPSEVAYLEVTFEYLADGESLSLPFHQVLSYYAGFALPSITFPMQLDELPAKQLEGMLRWLIDRLNKADELPLLTAGVLMAEIFAFLVRVFHPRRTPSRDAATGLQNVKHEIEQRYREPLTISELAERLQLSAGHFSRAFKNAFGVSPIAYQQELRLRAAMNLLATTTLSCKEIAVRVGYADQYYFSKAFKEAVGTPPSAYRAQHGG